MRIAKTDFSRAYRFNYSNSFGLTIAGTDLRQGSSAAPMLFRFVSAASQGFGSTRTCPHPSFMGAPPATCWPPAAGSF